MEEWSDFEDAYWFLNEGGIYQGTDPKYKGMKYQTGAIDTITQLQGMALWDIQGIRPEAVGWATLTRKQWGAVSSRMKEWVLLFRDLPLNTVFSAQHKAFNMPEEELIVTGGKTMTVLDPEVGPSLMPSVARTLNAAVHCIGNTFIHETVTKTTVKKKIVETVEMGYGLRIGPNTVYITKVRNPKSIITPQTINDPSYDKLITVIRGE